MVSPNRVSPLITGRGEMGFDLRSRREGFRCRSYGACRNSDTHFHKYFAPTERRSFGQRGPGFDR
jgi:hypothetical protein